MGIKQTFNKMKQIVRRIFGDPSDSTGTELDIETLKEMVQEIMSTHSDEISCGECFELMDRFVEMELAGKKAAEAMPLVQDHLDRCGNCREEFKALLIALRAMA